MIASDIVYWPYGGKFDEDGFSGRPRMFDTDTRVLDVARKVHHESAWHWRIFAEGGDTVAGPYEHGIEFPPRGFLAPCVSVEAVQADNGARTVSGIFDSPSLKGRFVANT